ncbi:hypothetical protein RJ639_017546 [Escallonia herrerae]|uniref:Uncharacterized protein n=1 Tax=Escallonia herrerae TaxID=1293975 RepID=A0AA89AKE0_9ASTE|nr:hypothetical protein RJ639_017546 [Escallonia herrerae]
MGLIWLLVAESMAVGAWGGDRVDMLGHLCRVLMVVVGAGGYGEEMRRQGHYGDSGGHSFASSQMQHMSGQRMDHKSGHYQGRPEPMTSEKEHPYGTLKAEVQWRWERDGSSHIQNEEETGSVLESPPLSAAL